MTDRPDRILLRAALQIHESLYRSQERPHVVELPDSAWAHALDGQQRLQIARSRGWNGAVRQVVRRLQTTLMCLQTELDLQLRNLAEHPPRPAMPSVPEILGDLTALKDEFDDVEIDLQRRTVRVRTDPIVLEGINLGPFEIRLSWSWTGGRLDYCVVALDPHRAGPNDSVTHPHVDGETLCEGEGRAAIRRVLETGRLLDLFLIVRQILETYNPSSAYVALSDWEGCPCPDCGDSVRDDDAVTCQGCEERRCWDCSGCCTGCEECFCSGCTSDCSACGDRFCGRCLNSCSDCEGDFCHECLTNEGICTECQSRADDEDEVVSSGSDAPDRPAAASVDAPGTAPSPAEAAATPQTVSGAAVHTDRLGQAAVPA